MTRYWLSFIHKFIGLSLGGVFVLIGLSGGVLVYRDAVDERLHPALMLVDSGFGQDFRPVDEIFDAAKSAMPPEAKAERITLPRHSRAAASITYVSETDDLDTYVYEIFVDPYTAQVKGRRLKIHGDDQFSQSFIDILTGFHWTLFLGANRAYVVGGIAIGIIFSVIIGFILWWPANGNWRLGLKIKWPATSERIIFDIHRAVGFYAGLILLISLFTGVAMIFKPTTQTLIRLVSPLHEKVDYGKSKAVDGHAPISPGVAVKVADTIFPKGRLHWILLPTSPTGVYVVGKQSSDEPSISRAFHNVGIDQYSGEITQIQDRDHNQFGDKFMEWLFPLHTGEFLGEGGRPAYVLLGLTPFILYLTGLSRWLYKRRIGKI